MPFGLNNAPTIFARVVVVAFKDFIQQFLQVCMDDWIVYGLDRNPLANICLMLERCRQHQIALSSKKCIFFPLFGILLGHNVCKKGLLVKPTKIALILSLSPPTNVKMLRAMLVHMGYYRKFIKGYVMITTPMEKLLKMDAAFEWNHKCQRSFDTLKAKMASAPILVFPD